MAIKILRSDHGASDLRREAAKTWDADQARRLLALALVMEGASRTDAATVCGMDRQTLRDWVHRYNALGIDGLVDRKAPGPPPRLTAAQQAELVRIVERGPDIADDGIVRWRRIDLRDVIAARFGVALHERTVGKVLDRLGFSHISVRPRHPKADDVAQEAFKKTSPTSSIARCRTPPRQSRSRSGSRMKPALARREA
jgi:transposase